MSERDETYGYGIHIYGMLARELYFYSISFVLADNNNNLFCIMGSILMRWMVNIVLLYAYILVQYCFRVFFIGPIIQGYCIDNISI